MSRRYGRGGTQQVLGLIVAEAMLTITGAFTAFMGATTFREHAERSAELSRGLYPVIQEPDYSDANRFVKLGVAVALIGIVSLIATILVATLKGRKTKKRIEALTSTGRGIFSEVGAITASDFLSFDSSTLADNEFTGVYILHNETKGLYYVGQSVRVFARVKQHFTGHGNGDVYADFKYGDSFTIKTIPLAESGYQSLNDLERDAIEAFDAHSKGYNMTKGNRR